MVKLLSVCGALLISLHTYAQTINALSVPGVQQFIDQMVEKHQFVHNELELIFGRTYLTIKQDTPSSSSTVPHKPRTWQSYSKLFLTENRIDKGVAFMQQYHNELQRAYEEFGVAPAIITAILGIETNYGNYTGEYPTLQTLTARAFGRDKRHQFYLNELEEFLLMVRENGLPPLSLKGSHAGALGAAQFISSSYNHYAVDFNNDGVIDLFNMVDSIGSVANYFAKHYWQKDGEFILPTPLQENTSTHPNKPQHTAHYWRERGVKLPTNIADDIKLSFIKIATDKGFDTFISFWNFYIITRYNHNNMYALAAVRLAEAITNKYTNNL